MHCALESRGTAARHAIIEVCSRELRHSGPVRYYRGVLSRVAAQRPARCALESYGTAARHAIIEVCSRELRHSVPARYYRGVLSRVAAQRPGTLL